jgi:outer membrane autotransporter protein
MRRTRLSLPSMLASRTSVLSRLSIGMACLLRAPSALAVCDNLAPASGETATCNASAPNPSTLPVVAVAGSTGVTVLVLPGAGISVNNSSGIVVRDSSAVQNFGTIQNSADSFDGITSQGSASGFGHNSVTNSGSIQTAGVASEGMYNGSAAVTMVNTAGGVIGTSGTGSAAMVDLSATGGGTLTNNGTLGTSGDGSHGMAAETSGDTVVNNGAITTSGTGSYGLFANAGSAGPGNTTLTNNGSINVSGLNAHGIVSLDASPGLVTNTGSIVAHGAGGLGAFFAQAVTFINTAGARLASEQANAIDANGGGTFTNAGTITGANVGLSIVGGDALIVNSGVIQGGTNSAISSTGPYATTITNTGQISSGGGVAVWTDTGVNTFNMDGGMVSGLIRQGTGINTFVMQAGQVDSVDQGGAQPRFTLNGGRVTGGLTNGGAVTITGGRIGSVALTAARNTFAMSGGQIDANLTAGSGDTSLTLSGGAIGGAVTLGNGANTMTVTGGAIGGPLTLGNGANTITVSGGSIAQGLASGNGATTFGWLGGGVIGGTVSFGAGGVVALLSNLSDANLGGVSALDGGAGQNSLTFDHTQTSGLSRFVNWDSIAVTNGSRLSLDDHGVTLGNAIAQTGLLDIDSTSTLAWNGGGQSLITTTVPGGRVTLSNAGTIDLTGGAGPRNTLVVGGDYIGHGGELRVQSVLGSDNSPSGKLVISQGAATGNTAIGVTNAAGTGALTLADGIMVVQAVQGGTTAATAFSLANPVKAGAYTYYLFRGGVAAGTGDNWYLRSSVTPVPPVSPPPVSPPVSPPLPPPVSPPVSPPLSLPPAPPLQNAPTPLYRIEVPLYAEIPSLTRELGIQQIGTFQDRAGEQSQLNETGALPAAWSRVWGNRTITSSDTGVDPHFNGAIGGMQIGQDLYADTTTGGHRDHYGFLLGVAHASGDVSGFALGMPAVQAGSLSIDAGSIGAYWMHIGVGGWYTDTLVIGSTLTIKPSSNDGVSPTTHGRSIAGSIEAGLPFPLAEGLSIEPQAQVIWQHVAIDDLNDGISSVAFTNPNAVAARLGLRLTGRMQGLGATWQPYARVNLWRYFNATSHVTFDGTTGIPAQSSSTIADIAAGVTVNLSARGSVFASVHYAMNASGAHRETVGGDANVRWRW